MWNREDCSHCFNRHKSSSLYSISSINNNTTPSYAMGSTCVLVPVLYCRPSPLQTFPRKVCNIADLPPGRFATLQTLPRKICNIADLPPRGKVCNIADLPPFIADLPHFCKIFGCIKKRVLIIIKDCTYKFCKVMGWMICRFCNKQIFKKITWSDNLSML